MLLTVDKRQVFKNSHEPHVPYNALLFPVTNYHPQERLKRALDFTVALVLILLLLPTLLLIAIAVKLDSPGSIIFVQERAGCRRRRVNGQLSWEMVSFPMYKFRSMVKDADSSAHHKHIRDYIAGNGHSSSGTQPALKGDMRVTRVGKIIRAWSLDELPQLFNVLKGDMSLVGPRPVPLYEVAEYSEGHYERLTALPGITGLWQVKGRCLLSFDEQIALDVMYARQQSIWLDLQILALTLPAVLQKVGAA